jgi:2-phospho-L-lactate transferase/gluconeogenesis factor (CofD/UPF0052 family)
MKPSCLLAPEYLQVFLEKKMLLKASYKPPHKENTTKNEGDGVLVRQSSKNLSISLFCGGRGSSTLIRELLRRPQVELNLLVNAYDDGLSTGALRNFIPGMLGPSDFRKNLSYLMELYSRQQFSLLKLLEYRFPNDFSAENFEKVISAIDNSSPSNDLNNLLRENLESLDFPVREKIKEYLSVFYEYYIKKEDRLDFSDCSLGNLVFCGAYLKNGFNFNQAAKELSKLFGSKANLINITNGENRILVGLKEDGELLDTEAKIVGQQSPARILDIYLMPAPLTEEQKSQIKSMSLEEKRQFLEKLEDKVRISDEARNALINSDIIIYGPGTQHSSLFPSYKTIGVPEAIQESKAKVKAFIVNLQKDCDIQSLSATDILDSALYYLKDRENLSSIVTHVLYNQRSNVLEEGVRYEKNKLFLNKLYKNALWIEEDFEHDLKPGVHSGIKIIDTIFSSLDFITFSRQPVLDIYVDLNERSLAVNHLIQEFIELDWKKYFSQVRLFLNQVNLPKIELPEYLAIKTTKYFGVFSDVSMFSNWLTQETSQYLATLTGDGEYRLRDIFLGIEVLKNHEFGAVYGSRTQSRRQVIQSLEAVYSDSKILHFISWSGAFVLTAIWGLFFNIIFSDPLTGFRIYKRDILQKKIKNSISLGRCRTASGLTRKMINSSIEIAEIPVKYKTFKGFTNIKFRLSRGLRNVWETLF